MLRGLHYQMRQPQGKLVRVTAGEIWDVAVDLRRGSPSFGRWVGGELDAESHRMLWVPAGFAHGFVVLSEQAEVHVQDHRLLRARARAHAAVERSGARHSLAARGRAGDDATRTGAARRSPARTSSTERPAALDFIDLKTQYAALRESINARIQRVLDHGQYVMGPEVTELEAALAARTGAAHCVAVASGTEALLIALLALDVKPGDEVVTTPFTLRRDRGNDRADRREAGVRGRRGGHGEHRRVPDRGRDHAAHPGDHAGVALRPAGRHGRDQRHRRAAQAAGDRGRGAELRRHATRAGKSCNLSTIGCTSFFPSKPLGCYGDGGALFTSDEALAKAMREIRVHGQEGRYQHTRIGVGGRMDSIQCAVVLAKLERFDWEVRQRVEIGAHYDALLASSRLKTAEGQARPHQRLRAVHGARRASAPRSSST